MIKLKSVKRFCGEDYTKIENYYEAVNDKVNSWDCHHRDEIRILPSGMVALRSVEELIENGRYYGCPANELIFLKHDEHTRLHSKHKDLTKFLDAAHAATKVKLKGKPKLNTEFSKKYYEKYHLLKEQDENLYFREYRFYRKHGVVSWEFTGVNSKAFSEFGKAFVEHYGIRRCDNLSLYGKELKFHKKYGKFSWEVENG